MEALFKTSKNGAAEELVFVLEQWDIHFEFIGRFGGESYFKVAVDRETLDELFRLELGRSCYDVKFSD